MPRSSAIARRVRREVNRLLAKRRYRERKDGKLAAVWSVRAGPPPPEPKAGVWSGRHGEGGTISQNHQRRRAAYEAGRLAAHDARVEARKRARQRK